MLKLALIFIGAGTGGVLRHGLAVLVQSRYGVTPPTFPYGTLVVNLVGCLAIGVLIVLVERLTSDALRDHTRAALMVGLLGGFTTFSAFGKETLELMQSGFAGRAALYVAMSVVGGVAAVWVGWAATRALA